MSPYLPDGHPANGDRETFKLSTNENPFPPLPSVAARVAELTATVNRYPETAARAITARISERFDVNAEEIVMGAGSVESVSQLMRATAGGGGEIVFPWRSFEAYPLLAAAAGAQPVPVPLASAFRHDFDALRAAITERTRLVIVCNPNNPTGTTSDAAEIEEFVGSVPEGVVVLIDEAYLHFNRAPSQPSGIDLFHRHPNVVVAHTFSKAYGLAGLRIGYALAPAPVAAVMRKVAVPFGVTNLAQAAAVASLDAEAELNQRVEQLIDERSRLQAELAAQGWQMTPSQTNFLWFAFGDETATAVECFERYGILARAFAGEGIRVTIGDARANAVLLAATRELARSCELMLDGR